MGSPARLPGNQATASAPGPLNSSSKHSISNYRTESGEGERTLPGLGMGAGRTPRKDRNKREGAKASFLLFGSSLVVGILAPDSAGDGEGATQAWGLLLRPWDQAGCPPVVGSHKVTQECVVSGDRSPRHCFIDCEEEPCPQLWSQALSAPSLA